MRRPRATCPACGNEFRVKADGSMAQHRRRTPQGYRMERCEGVDHFPTATVHVVPTDDWVAHDTANADTVCPCGPRAERVEADGDGWVLVHASLDGRELSR